MGHYHNKRIQEIPIWKQERHEGHIGGRIIRSLSARVMLCAILCAMLCAILRHELILDINHFHPDAAPHL